MQKATSGEVAFYFLAAEQKKLAFLLNLVRDSQLG
jgi:hypothetical protein